MKKLTTVWLAAFLLAGPLQAQTPPQPPPAQPEPQPRTRPRPGTIIDSGSGKITDQPLAARPVPAPVGPSAHPNVPGDALAGLKVDRFEAVGNTSVASDTIRVYLGIQPGDPYDPVAIRRNFLSLWQTGLFDDISIEADKSETGGVIVRAVVKERPRIGSVEYRGNKDLATNKITEVLDREKIDLHIGSTIEQTLLRRAAEAIKKAYTENGYEDPQVDPSIVDMGNTGEKKILFNIDEGVKAKIAAIDFTGNRHFSSRRLRSVMKEIKTHNIVTWIRKKDLYIPSKLDEDMERLKNYYQDFGYFDVAFGEPKITTIGKNTKKPRVKLLIPITEGTVHTYGDVSVAGNTVFTNQELIGNWPIKKGQTIRRKPIQDRADAFGEAYRMRGYIYAYVNPEYVNKPNNVIDVKLNVYEGDQFRLGKLEFQGNTVTKDKVLRREIFLEEGSIMDMETFKSSLYKLGQLGYFKVNDNPQHGLPGGGRIREPRQGRLDRVRLSPPPLRQPFARLRGGAGQDSLRDHVSARLERQRSGLGHRRLPLHRVEHRAVVRVRLPRQPVRHDARRQGRLLGRVFRRPARRLDPRAEADPEPHEVLPPVEADDVQHQHRGGTHLPARQELLEQPRAARGDEPAALRS